MQERGRKRGRIPSRLCIVSAELVAELNPTNGEIMTSPEMKSRKLTPLSHPGAPNVCLFLRERDRARVWEGQRERGRETQNLKQAPGSELSAQSLTQGSNSRTVRS